jgi:hypothetical protein
MTQVEAICQNVAPGRLEDLAVEAIADYQAGRARGI